MAGSDTRSRASQGSERQAVYSELNLAVTDHEDGRMQVSELWLDIPP
jgi:hypothetical protein